MNATINVSAIGYHKSEQQFKQSFEQYQNSLLVYTFRRNEL